MGRVSSEYGIPKPTPFVDVVLETDNKLFVDPSALRNHGGDARKHRAHRLVLTFFTEVLRCRFSSSPTDLAKGLSLLEPLHEPNETRLGFSRSGLQGHAFGDELAERLWDTLATNPACVHAVLTKLEDVPLFIRQVGPDLISDLTTRVVFEELADFTQQMMATYPSLAATTTSLPSPVWEPGTATWKVKTFTLPQSKGRQLLLIPRDWVGWRLLMTPQQFFNLYATTYVQVEQTTYASDGRRLAPSKKAIRRQNSDPRELNNRMAVKYRDDEPVDVYRRWIDQNYAPLTDDEIERRVT